MKERDNYDNDIRWVVDVHCPRCDQIRTQQVVKPALGLFWEFTVVINEFFNQFFNVAVIFCARELASVIQLDVCQF